MSWDLGLWLLLGSYSFRGIISFDLGQGSLKSEVREQVLGPVLGVFDKLREVGVSPYLSFILILSVLRMFESKEAVRGRLIGPKTWDRIIGNFFRNF